MKRSAEFWRGADWQWVHGATRSHIAEALAAAEAREAAQPTAAEVIAACEKHISDTLEGMPDKIDPRMKYREFQYHDYELDEMRKLLDLCAQWKEANHGK